MQPPPPPPQFPPPLPPGWTQHTAPAGQPYWFNPQTNISTYTRPLPLPPAFAPPLHFPLHPSAPPAPSHDQHQQPGAGGKKEKKEKPKTKTPILGTEWTRVVTNKGNTFYTNKTSKESVWSVPGEIRELVDKLDRAERGEGMLSVGTKRVREGWEGEGAEEEEEEEGEGAASLLDLEVEGAEGQGLLVVESLAPKPSTETSAQKEDEDQPKKKKQKKKKVIHDIEELERDEDWQRQVAAQMAADAASPPRDTDVDIDAAAAQLVGGVHSSEGADAGANDSASLEPTSNETTNDLLPPPHAHAPAGQPQSPSSIVSLSAPALVDKMATDKNHFEATTLHLCLWNRFGSMSISISIAGTSEMGRRRAQSPKPQATLQLRSRG